MNGGEGGIRTHGGLAPTAVFKTAALNHSATSPRMSVYRTQGLPISLRPQMCKRQLKPQASTHCLTHARQGRDRSWLRSGSLAFRAAEAASVYG
jgi:hypothetical protein